MISLLSFPPIILCFLGCMILVLLTSHLFLPVTLQGSYSSHSWDNRLTLFTLFICLVWSIKLYPTCENILLSGHFIWSPLTALLSASLFALSMFVFIYAKDCLFLNAMIINDYYTLGLLSLFGSFAMLTAGSLISCYLGLEIMSLSLYGMVALDSKEGLRVEAAIKYIIMGMLASALLLYGFCLLYCTDHNLSLCSFSGPVLCTYTPLAQIGASLVLAGFLFKLGAAPFHFWVPDVYQGASISTILFLATIPKFAVIGIGLRLFLDRLNYLTVYSQLLLLTLGLLSIIGGNLMTLMQSDIKRLLAYSSIAHMGFIILGLALPMTSYPIVLFYGITYCFMTALFLGTLAHLSRNELEIHTLQDLKGLSIRYPMAASLIFLAMSAMAGIPPLIGFFNKFGLFYHFLKQGFYFVAASALVSSVIGSYYYLNIVKCMYFDLPSTTSSTGPIKSHNTALLVLSGLILLSISVFPGALMELIEKSIGYQTLSIKNTHKE